MKTVESFERNDAVKFLLRRKFPDYDSVFESAFSPRTRNPDGVTLGDRNSGTDTNSYPFAEIIAYGKLLEQMPIEELQTLYSDELHEAAEKNRKALKKAIKEDKEKAAIDEQQRFFNQPAAAADFEHWGKADLWTLDEAVALSLGKAPKKVHWDRLKSYNWSLDEMYTNYSPFAARYAQIRDLAIRGTVAGHLLDPTLPGAFLSWASQHSISCPSELVEQVAKYSDTETDIAKVIEERNSFRERVRELEAENTPLNPKERRSLLLIIASMLAHKYDADQRGLAKNIAGVGTKLLYPIDEGTVRKYLKEAKAEFPKLD